MQPAILEQVRASLLDKRAALSQWLAVRPPLARAISLGPAGEAAPTDHLDSLEEHIAEAAMPATSGCAPCAMTSSTARGWWPTTPPRFAWIIFRPRRPPPPRAGARPGSSRPAGVASRRCADLPGLQVAAFTRPAQIIGGDYFDFLSYQGEVAGWAVGDVAGHGVAASLHMAGLQALCRAIIPTSDGPAAAAQKIQRLFVHNSRYTTFVSLFLAAYAPSSRTLLQPTATPGTIRRC